MEGEAPRRGRATGTWIPVVPAVSSRLRVGQTVYAIGNPFGLDQTLTSGLVSGVGREVKGIHGKVIRGVIQTDAAINPGNSGGPLLDAYGRLIGVNTMIYSSSGMFAGVGFAIPVDTVKRTVKELLTYGRVRKPGIGAYCLPDHLARRLGREGVVLQSVMRDGGADLAGLRGMGIGAPGIDFGRDVGGRPNVAVGDEIVAVGGEKVHTVEDLLTALEQFDAGDLCPMMVRRGSTGRVEEVHVRLAERWTVD